MTNAFCVNPYQYGMNPAAMQIAQFGNIYGGDLDSSISNNSIWNYDPSVMGMMGMYGCMNPMMMMNPMMNPAMMMNSMYTPQAYSASLNGKNPYAGVYFNGFNNGEWQTYENNRDLLNTGLKELHSFAISDQQDKFARKFNEILTSQIEIEKKMRPGITADQARSAALSHINSAYVTASNGKNLADVLRNYGDNPFFQGAKDVFSLNGFFDDKTAVAENIAAVSNLEGDRITAKREKRIQNAGFWTTAALGSAALVKWHKPIFEVIGKIPGWGKAIALLGLGAFAVSEIANQRTK